MFFVIFMRFYSPTYWVMFWKCSFLCRILTTWFTFQFEGVVRQLLTRKYSISDTMNNEEIFCRPSQIREQLHKGMSFKPQKKPQSPMVERRGLSTEDAEPALNQRGLPNDNAVPLDDKNTFVAPSTIQNRPSLYARRRQVLFWYSNLLPTYHLPIWIDLPIGFHICPLYKLARFVQGKGLQGIAFILLFHESYSYS